MDEAEAARLGLYEPGVDDPGDLELIAYLLGRGVSIEQMRDVKAVGLGGIALEMAVRPGGPPMPFEVGARRAGLSVEDAARLVRALGFPDPLLGGSPVREADVEILRLLGALSELIGADRTIDLARVAGSSTARIADAVVAQLRVNLEGPMRGAGATEFEVFEAFRGIADEMLPRWDAALGTLFRHFLADWIYQDWTLDEGGSTATIELACGFADIVGFTPQAAAMSTGDLSATVRSFDATVSEIVQARHGRVVKRIGDEIMFVVTDPTQGALIAIDLTEPALHAELPPMRAGVAFGPVIARDGDYFGPVVNLAARLVATAPPASALVSPELADALDTDVIRVDRLEEMELKGFAEPVAPAAVARA